MENKDAFFCCLHGFLGAPSDWDFLRQKFFGKTFYTPNLFAEKPESIKALSERVLYEAEKHCKPRILIGYSMGARLALTPFLQAPQLWDHAIFLSCHPGLTEEDERIKRLQSDQRWGERFVKEPFDQVLRDWNRQGVFQADLEQNVAEAQFDKKHLQEALNVWSLARQPDYRKALRETLVGYTWVVGEKDQKFVRLSKFVEDNPFATTITLSGVGHRLLFHTNELCKKIFHSL